MCCTVGVTLLSSLGGVIFVFVDVALNVIVTEDTKVLHVSRQAFVHLCVRAGLEVDDEPGESVEIFATSLTYLTLCKVYRLESTVVLFHHVCLPCGGVVEDCVAHVTGVSGAGLCLCWCVVCVVVSDEID